MDIVAGDVAGGENAIAGRVDVLENNLAALFMEGRLLEVIRRVLGKQINAGDFAFRFPVARLFAVNESAHREWRSDAHFQPSVSRRET